MIQKPIVNQKKSFVESQLNVNCNLILYPELMLTDNVFRWRELNRNFDTKTHALRGFTN